MKKSAIFTLIVASLLFAGYLSFFQKSSNALAQMQPRSGDQQASIVLSTTNNPQLGTILVGSSGMTLYIFLDDTNGTSTCTGQCALLWPPYVVNQGAASNIGSNIIGEVATITLPDGSSQVTYNGMPLYYYSKDTKQGDAFGEGLAGLWFVAKP